MKIRDGSRETSASQEINDFPSTATKPSFYNKKLFSLYKHSHAPLQEENNLNVAPFTVFVDREEDDDYNFI